VRRHDYLVNAIQLLIETLLFYHPVTWWLSARLREERELCCDDMVVEACDAVVYASALAESERIRIRTCAQPALALGANDGELLYRLRRLLAGDVPRRPTAAIVPVLVVCILAACAASAVDAPWHASSGARSSGVAVQEPHRVTRFDGGLGTPNPGERGEAAFAATLAASRAQGPNAPTSVAGA